MDYTGYLCIMSFVGIGVSCITGAIANSIYHNKGYEDNVGFWWGFWLGVIGIIVVACKESNIDYSLSSRYESPASQPWHCQCGRINSSFVTICYCGAPKPQPMAQQGSWRCHCGRVNASYVGSCYCGAVKPALANQGRPAAIPPVAAPAPVPAPAPAPVQSSLGAKTANDKVEELKKYKQAVDEGLLSQEEYEALKKKLLGI